MINLLPAEIKRAYRFGRINRHLAHWITVFVAGIIGAILITGFGYLYLDQTAKDYRNQINTSNQQLSAQHLNEVQSEVKDISNNLSLVVQVLSKQVLFSGLLQRLATLMPGDTNLTGLSISQSQGAISITAAAKNYSAASQIQVNLTDPSNQLFSKADIVGINCSGVTAYPCSIELRALFSADNQYMLINNKVNH